MFKYVSMILSRVKIGVQIQLNKKTQLHHCGGSYSIYCELDGSGAPWNARLLGVP